MGKIPKGFMSLGKEIFINKDIIKEIKEYNDNTCILTIYGEKFKIKKIKKENKNG